MSKRLVMIDLSDEEWAWLGVMQADVQPVSIVQPTASVDGLISSILRAVIEDDIEEERKRAA